ncbi:RecX family transcriptional regulator [Photobacterium rosenbergii]|uniref:RecX family transcriptional regulator n=1 Tax=Photobacterium rosenbergii TaxID=294936 RepID=UPI001C990EAB|nr:RecX family transcriptional regulator [Photobacterium rosenbergii]MBY5947837.1 RecX family transcriptional regulator [Photobacterium rosenbergii]
MTPDQPDNNDTRPSNRPAYEKQPGSKKYQPDTKKQVSGDTYGQKKTGPKPAQKVEDVYEYAIWWLNQRGYSVMKLKEKLTKKTTNTEWINQVIGRLLELGYLNDQRYAETYVNSRCRSYGPAKLTQKLRLQGVGQDDIDNALQTIEDSELEVLITRTISKYAGKKSARDISLRLQQEGVSPTKIQAIMAQALDLEHELKLAERLVNKHSKKMGRTGLIQKLRSEGISQEAIEQTLASDNSEQQENEDQQKALEHLNKKYKSPIVDFAEKKKATAFLVRKGFSFSDANYALEHHLE